MVRAWSTAGLRRALGCEHPIESAGRYPAEFFVWRLGAGVEYRWRLRRADLLRARRVLWCWQLRLHNSSGALWHYAMDRNLDWRGDRRLVRRGPRINLRTAARSLLYP